MPALVNISVGSFCGTSGALGDDLVPLGAEEVEERGADFGGGTVLHGKRRVLPRPAGGREPDLTSGPRPKAAMPPARFAAMVTFVQTAPQTPLGEASPWYALTAKTCTGRVRLCIESDDVCRARAEGDGYVAITSLAFCRRDDVNTVPTTTGLVTLMAVFASVFSAFIWIRRRRKRGR